MLYIFFCRITHRLIGLSFDATKVSCPGVLAAKKFIVARFAASIGATLWKRNKNPLPYPPDLPFSHTHSSASSTRLYSLVKKTCPNCAPAAAPFSTAVAAPAPASLLSPPPPTLSAAAGRLQMESEAPRRRLLRAPTNGLYGR